MERECEELKELIEKGILSDVLRAERAHAVLKEVGMNASEINNKTCMSELFSTFSTALQTEALLAVSRLFDPASSRHPTKSIRQTLKFLEDNKKKIPHPKEPPNLTKTMEDIGFSDTSIKRALICSTSFIDEINMFFLDKLESKHIQDDIKKLKRLRDKSLAHNEITSTSGPTWKSIMELVCIAKELIGILGWAYLGTVYINRKDFFLTRDAIRPSLQVEELIRAVSKD